MGGGDNGGVAGSDSRVIETHPDLKVDIRGIDNHQISDIPLVTAGGVTTNVTGEVIVIMHQHVHHSKNKTIYSSCQIKHYKNIVDDRPLKVGGGQHITTLDKYKIHMSIRGALPYMTLHPYTDKEWSNLPQVILTSDVDWDHACLD